MNTTTPFLTSSPVELARPAPAPLLDHGEGDGMSTDVASANALPAEQQLTRFLHWLQFTDRGHQPC